MAVEQNEIIKFAAELSLPDGVSGLNVYYWRRTDSTTPDPSGAATMAMLAEQVDLIWQEIAPEVSDAVTLVKGTGDIMVWNAVAQQWEVGRNLPDFPFGIPGGNVGEMLPHQNAAVITADTDKVRTRPKKFFAGFVENAQDAGKWGIPALTSLADAAALWQAVVSPAGLDFTFNPGTIANDGTFRNLGTIFVNEIVGSQRRRKIGSGS